MSTGFQLPFGIQPVNPVPVDFYSGPYSAATEVDAINAANYAIPSAVRFQSMEVRLIIAGTPHKYWYRDGIADGNLVEFLGTAGSSGTSGTSGSSGINGTSGTSGSSGTSSTAGSSGSSGANGTSGSSGGTGSSGASGSSGSSGANGTSGSSGSINISNVVPDPNSGIYTTTGSSGSSALIVSIGTIYNTTYADSVISGTVGGAGTHAASYWKAKTVVQVLDEILFPTLLPTYTIPTIVLSGTSGTYGSGSLTIEVGASIGSVNLGLVGTKNDAGAFTSLSINKNTNGGGSTNLTTSISPTVSTSGTMGSQYGYADPNDPILKYSINYTDSVSVMPAPATTSGTSSSIVYGATGNYGSGVSKYDNKGNLDSRSAAVRSAAAPQSSSTNFASSSITITGYYPYFWGVSNTSIVGSDVVTLIQAGSGNKVIAAGGGTLNITFGASGQYPWFAVPSSFGTKTSWFVNSLNQGSIGGSTDLFPAPSLLSVNSPSSLWSGVTYKIYIGKITTTTGSMQLIGP